MVIKVLSCTGYSSVSILRNSNKNSINILKTNLT